MDKKDRNREKQDRLAQALRDNLRRRKQPPRKFDQKSNEPNPGTALPDPALKDKNQ